MKTNNYAAIDIGGTNARIAIFKDEKIVFKQSFKTDIYQPRNTLKLLCQILKEHKINILGICIPGQADYESGVIILASNIPGWKGFNFRNYLLENAGIEKIVFQNDANVMAYGAHKYYQKTKKDISQFFTISTGLGAGLIINDDIYGGFDGRAQEIGYMPTAYNDKEKNHLSRGSAEYFCSGSGIEKRVLIATGKKLNAKQIFNSYLENKQFKEIIKDGIETLGNTIATSLALINPNSVIFGGSVAEHNHWYVEDAIEHAKSVTYKDQFDGVKFLKNPYGDDLALYGMYFYAKKKLN